MVSAKRQNFLYASITILWSVAFTILIMNQIWSRLDLHVPGEPFTKVDFTQPVDSIFYVRNAELGYRWLNTPTSIWFHPLVAWGIDILPTLITPNFRLWVLSFLSGFAGLLLLNQYIKEISVETINPWMLIIVPFIPGGLGIATGNAEFPCLVFMSLAVLSVLRRQKWYFPVLWGALGILTKPNAIYMILGLGIYIIWGHMKKDSKILRNSILGIASILITWAIWVGYVDFRAGHFGAYWAARRLGATVPLGTGFLNFMNNMIRLFVYTNNYSESLKFLIALAIPLVDIWILQTISLKSEAHRLSILFSVLSMLIVAMVLNNPNKIIVYSTTFPGHFAIGLLFIRQTFNLKDSVNGILKLVRISAGVSYLVFCALMVIFFIIGTPLSWYY